MVPIGWGAAAEPALTFGVGEGEGVLDGAADAESPGLAVGKASIASAAALEPEEYAKTVRRAPKSATVPTVVAAMAKPLNDPLFFFPLTSATTPKTAAASPNSKARTLSTGIQNRTSPTAANTNAVVVSTFPGSLEVEGASGTSSQNWCPSGAGPQLGLGCQPTGGCQPAGGAGQFGGEL